MSLTNKFTELCVKLKNYVYVNSPFNHETPILDRLIENMRVLQKDISEVKKELREEVEALRRDSKYHQTILDVIAEASPDMLWLKDINGKYIFANKKIREGLLLHPEPLGMSDVELAQRAKSIWGDENHTFGEVCGDSDPVVLDKLEKLRFLESGKIKGEMKYLEVFKSPVYFEGALIGVCGVGRDLTEYVEASRTGNCEKCSKMVDIFAKYEFQGKNKTDEKV